MIDVEALQKAAAECADLHVIDASKGKGFGWHSALVAAFLTGWRYANKGSQSETEGK
jgi:hypothetical protein